jgi:hypothetical protein
MLNRVYAFFNDLLDGYEPVMARNIFVAVFALLASFGLGSGNLPAGAEGILTFLAFAVPLYLGYRARQKVTPVKNLTQVPPQEVRGLTDESDSTPAQYPDPQGPAPKG